MKQGRDRFIAFPKETLELILMYRTEHKLSYRDIEKRLGVSRETARLYCLKMLPDEKSLSKKRVAKRKHQKVKNKVITRKKPLPQYNSIRDYDFLQYIRVVFRWALTNYPDLNRPQIELLLYFYPKGVFSFKEFYRHHKTVGMYQNLALDKLMKSGYIALWRPKRGNVSKLYALTSKAKHLCDMMHKYCVGDEKISEMEDNKMTSDDTARVNRYFVDLIKDMNKRKKAPE